MEKSEKLTLFLIWLFVSVMKTAELGSLAFILVCAPCSAGKNVECINAGFLYLRRGATSLVIRKYGSCGRRKLEVFFTRSMQINICKSQNLNFFS
jgi:hypothetical protein